MQNRSSKQTSLKSRELRKNQTKFEIILWNYLRNRRLCDLKFRRQEPIGFYIADFVCIEKKVVVELDGVHHFYDEAILYDSERDKFINASGFKVLRFKNSEIIENIEEVLKIISNACL